MIKQWFIIFLYYSIFLVVLSPLYFIVLFLSVMATDSGTDEAQQVGEIMMSVGIFLVTSIPFLISLMFFNNIRPKVKLITCIIFIIVIELIIFFRELPY